MIRLAQNIKLSVFSLLVLSFSACSSPQRLEPESVTKGEVVGGYVVRPADTMEMQVKQEREIARKQEEELKQQQKEIQDLKRQQYHNQQFKQYLDRTEAGGSK